MNALCPQEIAMETESNRVPKNPTVPNESRRSMEQPIHFRGDTLNIKSAMITSNQQSDISSIFKLLEDKTISFLRKELKRLEECLTQDPPAYLELLTEDEDLVDSSDQQQKSSAREGVLKITLHILRTMNQKDLADSLEKKMEPDVFELKKYTRSDDGLLRLLPVIKASRIAVLNNSNITEKSCKKLALTISSNSSNLRSLNLSNNNLKDSGVKLVFDGLGNPQCKLETVRLSGCKITQEGCTHFVSALCSNPSHLQELDLSCNNFGDSGIKVLSAGLEDPKCMLKKLSLNWCKLSKECCEVLAAVLKLNSSSLRELDLSDNDLQDSGVMLLSAGLKNPQCKIKILRLSGCRVTADCCSSLASALSSNPSHLQELDLSYNNIGDSGVRLLSAGLEHNICKLETLRLSGCHITEGSCGFLASLLSKYPYLLELELSDNQLGDPGVKLLFTGLQSLTCKLNKLRLNWCNLTKECCEVLASIVSSSSFSLRELDLDDNDLKDSGVNLLSAGLGNQQCQLEILRLSGCRITEEGCTYLASALQSNPSHLRELDLSYNYPGNSTRMLLSAGWEDRHFKLSVDHEGENRLKPGLRKYTSRLTLDPSTANPYLVLSHGNRKVTHVKEKQAYSDHPELFDCWPQVLCREGLSRRCYWEVDWSGNEVHVAVAYKDISRKGCDEDSCLGQNGRSWILECSCNGYRATYNKKNIDIPSPHSSSQTIGVYLDWTAGILNFYNVSSGKRTHLHTFHSMFTEPLYPAFMVCSDSSVTIHASSYSL